MHKASPEELVEMKSSLLTYLIIGIACSETVRAQWGSRQQARQNCITPENLYGSCVTLSYCPQLATVFRTQDPRVAEQYVLALHRACGTRNINGDPVVCCSKPLRDVESPITEVTTISFPTDSRPSFVQPVTSRNTRKPQDKNPFLPSVTTSQSTTERLTEITTQKTTTPRAVMSSTVIESKGSFCRGPDYREGECIALEQCQELLDMLIAKQKDVSFANFLRASNEFCGGSGTNVCCPVTESTTVAIQGRLVNTNEIPLRLPTEEEGCGYVNAAHKKIVGGQVSKKGAWPWVALIGYDDGLSSSPFKCGGALITARHVVTAAHCIRKDLAFVRLGEYNLTTDTEAKHIDIPVIRREVHPGYSRRDGHSDIALLYLDRNVEFSDFIAPICMPRTPELRRKSYVKVSPFVVGWGKTMEGGKSASVLQELQIPVFDNEVCLDSYRKLNRWFSQRQFDSAVLCAGVLNGGMDTCQGDSGGPLMAPEIFKDNIRYYLIGVVSYGIGCARPNVPGVYTSTQHFMDWIEEKIADTN